MTEDEDIDWSEVEDEHREQTERTDRAHESGHTFADIVAEQYRRLDDGDLNATVSAYDQHTAALLAALDESGELERVVETLQDELDEDTSGKATKSQLLVAATRYAVGSIDGDLLDEAREGYQEMQDTPF
jgi:hypothetical protein